MPPLNFSGENTLTSRAFIQQLNYTEPLQPIALNFEQTANEENLEENEFANLLNDVNMSELFGGQENQIFENETEVPEAIFHETVIADHTYTAFAQRSEINHPHLKYELI